MDRFKPQITAVYLLPMENYVGSTNNLNKRLSDHKKNGKDITGAIVLNLCKNRFEALIQEYVYLCLGYKSMDAYQRILFNKRNSKSYIGKSFFPECHPKSRKFIFSLETGERFKKRK